ncbi:DUF4253 domain-containing protein [Streptomyces monomycini]|uniref:DUF4253 domain-containing protein n=1 Tax=Streptomyces monomycini TaxID=371720 RepID=UPI0004AA6FAB|nr:DUF4253 domain-containing protein [Streptomyces monomycini]
MNKELLSPPLGTLLPPGRMITADEGDSDVAPLWLSDDAASAGLWARLRAEHAATGWWPLLLDRLGPGDDEFRPWASGELNPEDMSSPEAHSPAQLLATWWEMYAQDEHAQDGNGNGNGDGEAPRSPDGPPALTAPFGLSWPGCAPGQEPAADPDAAAAAFAQLFAARRPHLRLGLVAADRGADALTAVGWSGPANYDNDTAKYSAVVRDWERRFGARVVAVGFATLHLSVAAPPTDKEDALLVAAEHFAVCPDNLWQGSQPSLDSYAEHLIGAGQWEFWWD